jgi:hypothetical protein
MCHEGYVLDLKELIPIPFSVLGNGLLVPLEANHGKWLIFLNQVPLCGSPLSTEIVVEDIALFDTQIFQHFEDSGVHHWRTTDVVFDVLGRRVVLQVLIVQHLMDKARVAIPMVFGQWVRQGDMKFEVGEFFFNLIELIRIKQLPTAAATVPVGDFTFSFAAFKEFEDVAA